jgi:hypothetical protein
VAALIASAVGAATLLFGAGAPPPAHADDTAARKAAAYLAGLQGDDGSVPAGWRADQVAEAVVALAAGGGRNTAVARAVDYLAKNADRAASTGPYAGRIVAALVVVGRDPTAFAGVDFVARINEHYDPVSGSYGGNLYGDTLAMLGLLAAGVVPPDGALTRLRVGQCRDGGWSYQAGCLGKADTDTTSMAMSVLAASSPDGKASAEVGKGRMWLATAQRPSGCWGLEAGAVANANSCGLALSALAAIGERPDRAPWTGPDGRDPPADLRSLQLPSGAFQYRKDVAGPNDYATVQALPGLAGWAYPLRAVAVATTTTNTAPATERASAAHSAVPTTTSPTVKPMRTTTTSTTSTIETTTTEVPMAPLDTEPLAAGQPRRPALPQPTTTTKPVGPITLAATALAAIGAVTGIRWRRRRRS